MIDAMTPPPVQLNYNNTYNGNGNIFNINSYTDSMSNKTTNPGTINGSNDQDTNSVPTNSKQIKRKIDSADRAVQEVDQEAFNAASQDFDTRFRNMESSKKWELRSKKVVEDVIYKHGATILSRETDPYYKPLLSFIVNLDDDDTMALFNSEERSQMKEVFVELENVPAEFENAINAFETDNHENFDHQLTNLIRDSSGQVDKQIKRWLIQVFNDFLGNLSSGDFQIQHHETWYIVHVWSVVFDRLMSTIPGLTMDRGETCLECARDQKNCQHDFSSNDRQKMGTKVDGLVRTQSLHERVEYMCTESAAYLPKSDAARKDFRDTIKTIRSLHDILRGLHSKADFKRSATEKLQAFGLLQHGVTSSLLVMQQYGYITLLRRYAILTYPTMMEESFELIDLLKQTMRIRQTILTMRKIIREARREKTNKRDELMQPLLNSPAKLKRAKVDPGRG